MTGQPDPEDDNRGSANVAAVIAVIALLVIAWILIQKYAANVQMENCLIEGHRDCSPVTIIPSQ